MRAARRLRRGEGVHKDLARAIRLQLRSCELGYGPACTELALESPQLQWGLALFIRGCASNDYEACRHAADFLIEHGADPMRIRRLRLRAHHLAERDCRHQKPTACFSLAEHATDENTASKYYQLAREVYHRQCTKLGEAEACFELGRRQQTGSSTQPYLRRALLLATSNCHEDASVDACHLAATLHIEFPLAGANVNKGLALHATACDGGHRWSCVFLAKAFRAGDLTERDPARADRYAAQACALGETRYCRQQ